MVQSNTVQLQHFGDFSKFLRTIFFQMSFENFWLYLLGEVAMTQIIKNSYKLPLKVCELKG